MKLRSLIIDIINVLFIIPLYYFTKDSNIFLYTLSLYLYLILSSMFNHIDIYPNIKNYYDNKYIYSLNTIFKYTNISIIVINIFISIIVGLFSLLINNWFNIKGLVLVNVVMSLTLFIKPVIKNISSFVSVYNFKTLSDNLENIYKIINLILLIISSIICFKLLDISDYISISILYGCSIISFVIVYLFSYLLVLSNKIKKKQFKKREERINYKNEIKNIISRNINKSIVNVIKYSYLYISIIVLYFILSNRYGYSYDRVSEVINNCYLYAIGIINIIFFIIYYIEEDKINNIRENIINKCEVKLDDYLIKLFKMLLTIIVILSIISDSLWTVIFNNDYGYILYMFSNFGVFYIMYSIIISISIGIINDKKLYIALLSGLVIKLVLIVPLISSLYRMGYNLLYGDMLSSIIAYLVVIILLVISNSSKCRVDFINKFDKILNIIYYNIILCVILLLFSLIIPVKVDGRIEGLKVVIIYLFISFVYIFIRRKIDKNERFNICDRKEN